MIFKIATSSIIDIVANNESLETTANMNKTSDWEFQKKPGMLYAVVRAVSVGTNGNGDHFTYDELKRAYKSFVGKGVFVNHQSSDIEKKRGMIVDAKFMEERGPENAYVTAVLEINAEAFPELATMIRSGHANSVSMGCQVAYSNCSICNHAAKTVKDYCMHVKMNKGGVYNGRPVFEINNGVEFIEISMVTTGADANAKVLEIFARQHGLNLQELMQKAASTEDPNFVSKLEEQLNSEIQPPPLEEGLEKTDQGDVQDIESPSDKINDGEPKDLIVIKIQALINEAALLRDAGVDNSIILAELDRWNHYYKEAQLISMEQELNTILQVADKHIQNNIDCAALLLQAEKLAKILHAEKKFYTPKEKKNKNVLELDKPIKPGKYKMKPDELQDFFKANRGTGAHKNTSEKRKKNPFKNDD